MRWLLSVALALSLVSPALAQPTTTTNLQPVATDPVAQSQASQALAAAQAAQAAVAQETAARISVLSGYVRSVSSIGPDTSGNVPGLATTAMVQTAIVDVVQMSTPASGSTVQAAAATTVLFINNSALLASLTIGLPPSPVDGQRFTVSVKGIITTLGFTGGTIATGLLSTMSASGYARFIYSASLGAWFRAG